MELEIQWLSNFIFFCTRFVTWYQKLVILVQNVDNLLRMLVTFQILEILEVLGLLNILMLRDKLKGLVSTIY